MIKKQGGLAGALTALMLLVTVASASAHSTSIGFENAGPGSVNIWLGTYQHGGHHLEGSLRLEGVLGTVFGPTINPFTILTPTGVANKPAGLINGVTNFFPSAGLGVDAPLTGDESIWEGICPACVPTNHWQGVNFVSLGPGDYQFTYVPIASPTAEWTPWNDNFNGTFDLTGVVEPPGPPSVPGPATLTLLGLGLTGLALLRKARARLDSARLPK